jgi:PPOX class probable F420-dependent enzyme
MKPLPGDGGASLVMFQEVIEMHIPQEIRSLIESGITANYITLNADGSPHVTCVWVGMDGDEIVTGHLIENKKVKNVRRDPRVAISLQADTKSSYGLQEYAVLYGRAYIQEGGAPQVLQRLAGVYFGPGVKYPPMDNPPDGFVIRFRLDKVAGVGPWTGRPM